VSLIRCTLSLLYSSIACCITLDCSGRPTGPTDCWWDFHHRSVVRLPVVRPSMASCERVPPLRRPRARSHSVLSPAHHSSLQPHWVSKYVSQQCERSTAVSKDTSLLWELSCHTGSHSVTCHSSHVILKVVFDLVTLKGVWGWVNLVGWLHIKVMYQYPKSVTHPSTNCTVTCWLFHGKH